MSSNDQHLIEIPKPQPQSFDDNLHSRTRRVISHLASGDEIESLSFGSLKEVIDALAEMNHQVVKIALVRDYFEDSVKMFDFCNSLENCLQRAKNSQTIIQLAIRKFEEKQEEQGEDRLSNLHQLRRIKEADDPITDDFVDLLNALHKQHVSMLEKLQAQRRYLDNKMSKVRRQRRLSNILFATAFILVWIFFVVAAAINAPPVVLTLAGALTILIVPIGKWFDTLLWSPYENTLKDQKEVLKLMGVSTRVEVKEIKNIEKLTDKLKIETAAMLEKTEFAIKQEDAVRIVISEIKNKMQAFMWTIEDVRARADRCSRDIKQARTVILQKILQRTDDSTTAPSILDAL